MKGTWMAAGVLAVAGVAALPAESRADTRIGIGIFVGRDSRYGHPDTFRLGYERGYREGTEHGYKDGRRGKSFNFRHDGDYRDADEGYKGWMGPRWEYANGFRRGYEEGYRRSFSNGRAEGDARYRYRDRDDRYGRDRDRIIYEERDREWRR